MKILVPLNDEKDILNFAEAGADEIYLGFYDGKWIERFGKYADLNRMSGFGTKANRYDFDALIRIVKEIKKAGMSAFITLNANCYSEEQIVYIEEHYLPALNGLVDGVIVSDVVLAEKTIKFGIPVIASTMMGVYNSDIASYYYQLGIKRMIVPRDLSLEEIESIHAHLPDVQLEAFFMRNGCVFSDGFCLGTHRPECGSVCGGLNSAHRVVVASFDDFEHLHDIEVNSKLYHGYFHHWACAMCALYRLKKIGIESLKIVGRADAPWAVCDDIKVTKRNLALIEDCNTEKEYLKKMIFPSQGITNCGMGLSCYYPEVRF